MDNKNFFDNVRKEANSALSKVFDKVEEVSKTSAMRLKISSLKSQIKVLKREIGGYVYTNKSKFSDNEELQAIFQKIDKLEEEIEFKKDQITEIKEKEECEEDIEDDKDFTL